MVEEWKKVVGYEEFYEVSNIGRVKNTKNGNIVKGMKHNVGYVRIALPNGKRKLLHRIVAEAFIPNELNKPFINHIDNNGKNNSVENLEWCTQRENMQHALKQGRLDSRISESLVKCHKAMSDKSIQNAVKKVGTISNGWEIISITEKRSKSGNIIAIMKCLKCNNEYERRLNATSKMCIKCMYKNR